MLSIKVTAVLRHDIREQPRALKLTVADYKVLSVGLYQPIAHQSWLVLEDYFGSWLVR